MANGSMLVYSYLNRNTDIKRNISRGVINIRALAKFILNENPELNLSQTGVITALRRYVEDADFDQKQKSLDKIFQNTKLEMSFGNVIMHIDKTESSINALIDLLKKLNFNGKGHLNIVMGEASFAMMFDNEVYDLVSKQFENENIIKEINKVGKVTLKLDPAVMETPNVFATILNGVGINDINVLDSITKRERFMIFVKEEELMKTCNVLYKFTSEARKGKEKVVIV